jgi:hypothetical protein
MCLFETCARLNYSYSTKQAYCRHIVIHHDIELPAGGYFLMPNSNYFKQGGFKCTSCNSHFCRLDHFKKHQNSELHCKYSSYVTITFNNPKVVHAIVDSESSENNHDLRRIGLNS